MIKPFWYPYPARLPQNGTTYLVTVHFPGFPGDNVFPRTYQRSRFFATNHDDARVKAWAKMPSKGWHSYSEKKPKEWGIYLVRSKATLSDLQDYEYAAATWQPRLGRFFDRKARDERILDWMEMPAPKLMQEAQ